MASIPAFGILLAPELARAAPPAGEGGVINGVVKNSTNGEPIENALVVLQCSCLGEQQERYTNGRGIYSFTDLPAGNYTIQVLSGKADISKVTELPRGAKFRANFSINPSQDQVIEIVVDATPVPSNNTATGVRVDMTQAQNIPVGNSTSRDFTAVVDIAPTASQTAGGISLAGTTAPSRSTRSTEPTSPAPRSAPSPRRWSRSSSRTSRSAKPATTRSSAARPVAWSRPGVWPATTSSAVRRSSGSRRAWPSRASSPRPTRPCA
ncbi:MAG: carboxypeptidase-like regulatory domain-containing protein [Deltaproteobacteria bacterium]|nr:carboxypeptidase-like regulatory domain-containing protein [Deltaproteobacteria bacterium]